MTLLSSFEHADFRSLVLALAVAVVGAGLLATPVQAQEEGPEAKRLEGVTWNSVVLVSFEPGKANRGMEIIADHFIPASKKAGTQVPRVINMETGPWDLMLVWEMKDGPSEMTWERSPENAKFEKTMMEMAGGKKEAEKIWDEYFSLVDEGTSFIGYSGKHGAPIMAKTPE